MIRGALRGRRSLPRNRNRLLDDAPQLVCHFTRVTLRMRMLPGLIAVTLFAAPAFG